MDGETRQYVADLIHTAADLYRQAVGLLTEAARIVGGETRDQPAADYQPPADLTEGVTDPEPRPRDDRRLHLSDRPDGPPALRRVRVGLLRLGRTPV